MREAAPVAIDETRHGRHIDHALERVDSTRTEAERLLFAAYCLSESRLANGIMRSAALRRGALCVLRQDVHVQLTDPYGAVHTLRAHEPCSAIASTRWRASTKRPPPRGGRSGNWVG